MRSQLPKPPQHCSGRGLNPLTLRALCCFLLFPLEHEKQLQLPPEKKTNQPAWKSKEAEVAADCRARRFLQLHRKTEKIQPLRTGSKVQHWLCGCSSQGCLPTFTVPGAQKIIIVITTIKKPSKSGVPLCPPAPRAHLRSARSTHRGRRAGPCGR